MEPCWAALGMSVGPPGSLFLEAAEPALLQSGERIGLESTQELSVGHCYSRLLRGKETRSVGTQEESGLLCPLCAHKHVHPDTRAHSLFK